MRCSTVVKAVNGGTSAMLKHISNCKGPTKVLVSGQRTLNMPLNLSNSNFNSCAWNWSIPIPQFHSSSPIPIPDKPSTCNHWIGPNKVYSYSSVAIIGFLPLASFLIFGAQWSHLALFCQNPVFLLSNGRIPDSHAFWVMTSRTFSFLGGGLGLFGRVFCLYFASSTVFVPAGSAILNVLV